MEARRRRLERDDLGILFLPGAYDALSEGWGSSGGCSHASSSPVAVLSEYRGCVEMRAATEVGYFASSDKPRHGGS